MTEKIRGLRIKGLRAVKATDGKHALIGFDRHKPAPNGQTTVWMAVPTRMLPYLATMAIKQMPQPSGEAIKDAALAFPAFEVAFGTNADGRHILNITLEQGATISYELDDGQLSGLSQVMAQSAAALSMKPPKGSKPN